MTPARRLLQIGLAGAAVLALASSGQAYIRLSNQGTGLIHRGSPVPYTIHASGSDDVPDGSDLSAVRLAFGTWAAVDGTALAFREDTAGAFGPRVHANDGLNLVMFDETNSTGLFTNASFVIAITPVFFDAAGGILDADVVFNGQDHTFGVDLGAGKYDIQNIATHEIGHFIGLDHSGIHGSSLVPFAYPGESRLRSLSWDERAAAAAIYPGAASTTLGSFTGQVIRNATSRGIDGAHVVAVNVSTGEPEASALTDGAGSFTLALLRAGTYRVYAEPLDGPCGDPNIQRDGLEIGFSTAFYGTIDQPSGFALSPGQRGLNVGQLRLGEPAGSFNLEGAVPRQVLRGTTATVSLSGAGISAGMTVEVAGTGVRLGVEAPTNRGVLTPGSSFTCSIDPTATPGLRDIYVYRGSGATREMVALPGGFEVLAAAPAIEALTPSEGAAAGGESIAVRGTGFQSGARVLFADRIAATTFVSSTELRATAPSNVVGAVPVTVVNADGQQAVRNGAYMYVGRPIVDSIAPAQGPSAGGAPVTILGSQFSASSQVQFDGRAATGIVVSDQGQRLDCLAPSGAAGTAADVAVTNPGAGGGTTLRTDAYRWIDPQLDRIDPASGQAAGGTVVQILGDGFSRNARVDFGARRSPNVSWISQFELRATTPAGTVGQLVDVTVVTTDGRADVLRGAFTYAAGLDPRILAVSPPRGYVDGGLAVRINGTNLSGAAVKFGDRDSLGVTVISPTEIEAISPPGASAGAVDVVVRNTDGLQAKAFGAFTYEAPATVSAASSSGGGSGGGGCHARPGGGSAADALGSLLPLAALAIILRLALRATPGYTRFSLRSERVILWRRAAAHGRRGGARLARARAPA